MVGLINDEAILFVHGYHLHSTVLSASIVLHFAGKVNSYSPPPRETAKKRTYIQNRRLIFGTSATPSIHSFFTPLWYNNLYIRFCFTQYTILPKGRSPYAEKIPRQEDP